MIPNGPCRRLVQLLAGRKVRLHYEPKPWQKNLIAGRNPSSPNGRSVKEGSFSDRVGAVIQGRYKLTQFLGRGGMGAVFLCEDLRLPGKRWALKEMLATDKEVLEQIQDSFQREAAMLSRLRHRNLPMIVDYFIEEDRQYLVMEYVEGETLARYVQREGAASELQTMRWGLELAQVLDYLHRQEKPVIFRDMKPDNIILTEGLHVKLVDFGLARQFDPVKRRDTQASAGSVGYAPPEQWEDLQQTDERSDIYSLGATLYYVLTSRPPSPVYGSQRIRPYRPQIDQGAEAIVLRCLQPEPSERYRTSSELIRDLLLWLSRQQPEDVETPRPSLSQVEIANDPVPSGVPTLPSRSRVHDVPRSLTKLLHAATAMFIAGSCLGLVQFWPRSGPLPTRVDPVLKILQTTEAEKNGARLLISRKQYHEAIGVLDRIVTLHPRDAEAHILKNNAYVLMQGKPCYRVPVLDSITGREREGFQLLYGLALAQQELNMKGVGGRQLVLDLYDTESRQDRALELANEMGKNKDYACAIGPFTSQQTIATAPIFENAGLPAIAPIASDPRVWEAGKNIFTASDSDVGRVTILAQYFAKQGLHQGVVLHNEESIVSRSMATEFIEAYTRGGGQILQSLAYDESTNLAPLLEKIREIPAEFVFLSEYRSEVIDNVCHQLRAMKLRIPVATEAVVWSENPLLAAGADLDGMLTSTYFHPDIQQPEIQSFVEKFGRNFGRLVPSHREALSYDSLMLLAKAIESVGFERDKLRAYFQQVGRDQPPYQGVTGSFAPALRLDKRTAYLVQIKGGKFVLRND